MEYQPISDRQLKLGYWYITHKMQLKNILIAALFLINFIIYGFIIFSLVVAVGIKFAQERQMAADIASDNVTNYQGILQTTAPKAIATVSLQSLSSFGEKIDMVAKVQNPNSKWSATFTYAFQYNGGITEPRQGFILPGEEKYLLDLDVAATEVLGIKFDNVVWKRENNFAQILSTRELFSFDKVDFFGPADATGSGYSRVVFTVTNNSNFNYYQPTFQVALLNGASLAGMQTITVDSLMSGQSRELEVRWPERLPSVQQAEIIPDINYLDPEAYIKF